MIERICSIEMLGVVLIAAGVGLALLRHEVGARLNAITQKMSDADHVKRGSSFHLNAGITPQACIGLGVALGLLGVTMVLML